ncbi:MAG: hypothetical protein ABIG63_04690 [Chloroflexota bacterium]
MQLTKAQKAFLESLKEHDEAGKWLWVECFPTERRTASSLVRRGLVEIMEDAPSDDGWFEARLVNNPPDLNTPDNMLDLARRLALALADEVAFTGEANAAERSLQVLAEARDALGLEKEFDEIDSLRGEK